METGSLKPFACGRCAECDGGRGHEYCLSPRGGTQPEAPHPYRAAAMMVGCLVEEKQAAYGDSFGKAGRILRELYPDGIKPEQLDDALTITRVVDKLFRIATKKDAFGESPWKDIMGYALLSVVRDGNKK